MLKVACPKCGIKLSAPPEYAGRKVSCQQCKTQFQLPDATKPDPPPRIATTPAIRTPATPAVTEPPKIQTQESVASAGVPVSQAVDSRFSNPPAAQNPNPYSHAPPEGMQDPSAQLNSISDIAKKPKFSQTLAGDLVESRSVLSLFDFKFKNFVSPMLVRISWIITVVLACISIGLAFVVLIIGMISISSASLDQNLNQLPMAQAGIGNVQLGQDHGTGENVVMSEDIRDAINADFAPFQAQGDLNNSFRSYGIIGLLITFGLWLLYTLLALMFSRVMHEIVIVGFNIAGTLKSIDAKLDR